MESSSISPKKKKMESSSSSKWCNLPSDILLSISEKLHGNYDHQLRAVCNSWNSSLPSKTHSNFPLQIPCPIIPTPETKEQVLSFSKRFRFWVVERSVILISPLKKEAQTPSSWIAKIEETGLNKHSVFCPLTGVRISPCCCNSHENNNVRTLLPQHINLLDFCVTEITKAYTILWVDTEGCYHTHSCSPAELDGYLGIKKIITYDVSAEGIIVLLALRDDDGKLAYWRSGFEEWKMVDFFQVFVDIMCFDGKFCAVDLQGGLIMIDPLTLQPIESVERAYDNGYVFSSYLVQCEKHLYLVKIEINEDEFVNNEWDDNVGFTEKCVYMDCLVLTEKGWVFNRGFGPKDNGVFFLGKDVTYSLSAKQHLGWVRGNFAFYGGMLQDFFELSKKFDLFMNMYSKKDTLEYDPISSEDIDLSGVYDYRNTSYHAFENCPYDYLDRTNIFWPPQEHESNPTL